MTPTAPKRYSSRPLLEVFLLERRFGDGLTICGPWDN
jgi:hypothetical protein